MLGDESYGVRSDAEERLLESGESARKALATGLDSADPEVRRRSEQLLKALDVKKARAYRAALEERLAEFVNDEQAGKKDLDFPGWKRFRDTVGHDRAARELFAEMQRAEPELLMELDRSDAKQVAQSLEARVRAIMRSMSHPLPRFRTPVTAGRGAALYFIATTKGVDVSSTSTSQFYSMAFQPDFRAAMQDEDSAPVLKKILGQWVAADQSGDANLAYYKVMLAMNLELKEGLQAGLRLVKDGAEGVRAHQFLQGLLAVGRFGSKENVADVEPLLANKMQCYAITLNRIAYTTEVRDVALAVLIHLTSQNHAEYGFDRIQKTPQSLFAAHTLGFPKDDAGKREAALGKWERWKAGQPRDTTNRKDAAKDSAKPEPTPVAPSSGNSPEKPAEKPGEKPAAKPVDNATPRP